MKINSLKNIVPLQYNGFYSIHSYKNITKGKIHNLPLISTFSRNFNKSINKKSYFSTTINSYNKSSELFSKKTKEFDNNLEKVPYPSFMRLTNYLKSKNLKYKTKINNRSSPNRVNEVYLKINKTESNQFNTEKFLNNEEMKNSKGQSKIKLIKSKNNKLTIDNIIEKEKEEFKKTVKIPIKLNKVIDKCSLIIYHHFFPCGENDSNNYNNSNQINKNNLKLKIIDKKNASSTMETDYIKHNSFFEMIIEKVIHLVEYKNHLNQKISINVVKNLLSEEIYSMYNNLTKKDNCSKITYESIRINKSTSTDDNYNMDFKLLNSNYYDKYSYASSVSDVDIEEKAKKKLEKKLTILNKKYGFESKNNQVNVNYDLFSNYSFNIDNYSQSESENFIRSKNSIYTEENCDSNYGDYIMSIANNINDNLYNYKTNNNSNNEKEKIQEKSKVYIILIIK